jgi:hypothetical protein
LAQICLIERGRSFALAFIEGTKDAQARDEATYEHRSCLPGSRREIRGAKEKRDISLRRLASDSLGTSNGWNRIRGAQSALCHPQ